MKLSEEIKAVIQIATMTDRYIKRPLFIEFNSPITFNINGACYISCLIEIKDRVVGFVCDDCTIYFDVLKNKDKYRLRLASISFC